MMLTKKHKPQKESWAVSFTQEILCNLPVNRRAPYFKAGCEHSIEQLKTLTGVFVLLQFLDMSDEEAVHHLACNPMWRESLNMAEEPDSTRHIDPAALSRVRSVIIENQLESAIFRRITGKLNALLPSHADKESFDSSQITSNIRQLGRITVISSGIRRFLVSLKQSKRDRFETINKRVVGRYLPKQKSAFFSMVKPSESQMMLESVYSDLFILVHQCETGSEVNDIHGYTQLERTRNVRFNRNEAVTPSTRNTNDVGQHPLYLNTQTQCCA